MGEERERFEMSSIIVLNKDCGSHINGNEMHMVNWYCQHGGGVLEDKSHLFKEEEKCLGQVPTLFLLVFIFSSKKSLQLKALALSF